MHESKLTYSEEGFKGSSLPVVRQGFKGLSEIIKNKGG
jgi:hypothetical protein